MDGVKTGGLPNARISLGEPVYGLNGARHKCGETLIYAFVWNLGTCRLDDKGETQVETPQD
jgi:hypothetical protein